MKKINYLVANQLKNNPKVIKKKGNIIYFSSGFTDQLMPGYNVHLGLPEERGKIYLAISMAELESTLPVKGQKTFKVSSPLIKNAYFDGNYQYFGDVFIDEENNIAWKIFHKIEKIVLLRPKIKVAKSKAASKKVASQKVIKSKGAAKTKIGIAEGIKNTLAKPITAKRNDAEAQKGNQSGAKEATVATDPPKRKRGRPAKVQTATVATDPPKRRRGRPAKVQTATVATDPPKRRRGRPAKIKVTNNGVSKTIAVAGAVSKSV